MRIAHVGDIHLLDGPNLDDTLQALAQVRDIVVERGVDLVLIPGDIYDRKSSPHERALMADWLDNLAPVPVLIVRGNHDAPEDLLTLGLASHVRVFERPELVSIGPIDVLCLPWPERAHLAAAGLTGEGGLQAAQAALGDLIRGMAANRDTSRPLVIMGHLSVVGALSSSGQPLVGREIQVVEADLTDCAPEAICLNHIHKPQDLYAGSLTVQDFGEADEEKRVVLVDTGALTQESIPIHGRRWVTIDASHPEGEEIEEVRGIQDVTGATGEDFPDANVRYRYTCTEDEAHLFDHAALERRFEGAHSLKIVPNITRATRVRSADVADAKTTAEKLQAWGAATGTEISAGVLRKLESLEGGA